MAMRLMEADRLRGAMRPRLPSRRPRGGAARRMASSGGKRGKHGQADDDSERAAEIEHQPGGGGEQDPAAEQTQGEPGCGSPDDSFARFGFDARAG